MPKSFQQKLFDALLLQAVIFMLYLVAMALFSGEPFAVTLPIDLTFGFGVLITAGVITFMAIKQEQRDESPCHGCRRRGFCIDAEQNCPTQHCRQLINGQTATHEVAVSVDHRALGPHEVRFVRDSAQTAADHRQQSADPSHPQ